MEIKQTEEFKKDIKKLDGSFREELKRVIIKIIERAMFGKPMKHVKNVFSERIRNKRLLYMFENNTLIFLCFKSRKEVYDWLREFLG